MVVAVSLATSPLPAPSLSNLEKEVLELADITRKCGEKSYDKKSGVWYYSLTTENKVSVRYGQARLRFYFDTDKTRLNFYDVEALFDEGTDLPFSLGSWVEFKNGEYELDGVRKDEFVDDIKKIRDNLPYQCLGNS